MSKHQIEKLHEAFLYGKHLKLGYTLAAIAWKESQCGAVRINMNKTSIDLGLFHLNSKSFLDRWYLLHPNKKRTHYYDNVLLSKIMMNDEYAATYAIKELLYWGAIRKDYVLAIKSYNCGVDIKRKRCTAYANSITERVAILQREFNW